MSQPALQDDVHYRRRHQPIPPEVEELPQLVDYIGDLGILLREAIRLNQVEAESHLLEVLVVSS